MARIIPTDNTPGAREAGTIDFLDRYLSGIGYVRTAAASRPSKESGPTPGADGSR